MIHRASYALVSALVLTGCAPVAMSTDALIGLPYSEKLKTHRFERNGAVYLAELRQRNDVTPAFPPTDFDIAISRADGQFTTTHADRNEAADAAATYCAKLGGAHDDRARPVFRAASDAVGNAEWVFPGWCDLPHPSQIDIKIDPVTPMVTQ